MKAQVSRKSSVVSRKGEKRLTTYDLPLTIKFETFIKKNPLLVFTGAALLLIFIVFHRFLLLNDVYIFKDTGSDTINLYWPSFVHLSEYLRNTGFPKWSFNSGTGKNIYPFSIGIPFNLALCLLPKDDIPYGIIFMEVLKIYLGGLFFFLFLRTLKMTAFTSIIGGLLYSFCGYMIIGTGWYAFSTEAVYAALVLYSTEKFLRDGAWYLVPVPFFLIAAFQPFLLYLYGVLITIYCIVRITIPNPKNLLPTLTITLLKIGALVIFGVILSSFIFLSDIDLLLHTPRSFGGQASNFKTMVSAPIFSTALILEITTSLYRFFSNDFLGTANDFKGWVHYLEAPILYTGLLTCLLMPQAFFLPQPAKVDKRKRIIYLGLTILAIIPIVFPFFRHAFWLFSGDYYRTYSLFVSFLFLILCLKTLSAMDSGTKINTPVLFITLAVLLILLYYPFYSSELNLLNNSLRLVAAIFLIIYTCLIYLISRKSSVVSHQSSIAPFPLRPMTYDLRLVLGLCILTELSYCSYYSVNHRSVVTSAELHEKTGYNDYTNEAIAYINSNDASFFRVDKIYSSGPSKNDGGYNDGLIQNYKGTSSYDSFNQLYYCNFLNELNVWSKEGSNFRKVAPCLTRPLLTIILNEKYLLIKQPYSKIPSQYDSLTTTGNITVTRNTLFLPFGYTYKNYISLSEFNKLNNFQKDKMLFRAFVADSTFGIQLATYNLQQLYSKDTIPGTSLDLNEFKKYTDSLRKDSLSNLVYNQNMVKGTIKLSQTKLLFLTIPYDKGWELKVDGVPMAIGIKPLLTNIGFTGVLLTQGEHSIELNYEPPYLKLGCYISGFSLLGYLLLFLGYRKKRF